MILGNLNPDRPWPVGRLLPMGFGALESPLKMAAYVSSFYISTSLVEMFTLYYEKIRDG